MAWQYKREEQQDFDEIPEGTYLVAIEKAEMAISKSSGNDMMVVQLMVSGYNSHLWYYIPFLDDRPEITNRMLTALFDSFGIEEGNFDLISYVGKIGAAKVKHDEQGRAKVSYFLKKEKQTNLGLGTWTGNLPQPAAGGFSELKDDESKIPF